MPNASSFLLMCPSQPISTLFPYTTLFRSHAMVRSRLGERAAGAAVLVAALHPTLVKASAQVLPESLAAALLLAWMAALRSEEHTSELQSHHDLVCRLLLEKKKK